MTKEKFLEETTFFKEAIHKRVVSGIAPRLLEGGTPPNEYAALAHILGMVEAWERYLATPSPGAAEVSERQIGWVAAFMRGVLWSQGFAVCTPPMPPRGK
jgi:hypothetical protein